MERDLGFPKGNQGLNHKNEAHRLGPSTHDFTESTQLKTVVLSRTQHEKSRQREEDPRPEKEKTHTRA